MPSDNLTKEMRSTSCQGRGQWRGYGQWTGRGLNRGRQCTGEAFFQMPLNVVMVIHAGTAMLKYVIVAGSLDL